jgi:hypothetical protein
MLNNNTRLIYKRWKKSNISSAVAFEKITGKIYAEDTARKYMNAVGVLLKSQLEGRLDGQKIEVKLEQSTNDKGETIYTQTSNMLITIEELENKTPSEIMMLHGYDPLKWELISSTNKAWNGSSKKQGTYTLFSSSVKVKPLGSEINTDIAKEVFNGLIPPKMDKIEYKGGNKLLELPIMDLHLGKLAWDKESGDDYDLEIAEKLYKATIADILTRLKDTEIEWILFPIGQDFFNSDDDKGNTNKGTQQDMDSRWQKIYQKGCELVIWAVEQLRQIAPVDICYVAGNHCYTTSYYLTLNTFSWYRNCEDVKISLSPKARKYYQYGKCMIGYSHGEETKKRRDKLMQAEAPEIWGNTIFREFHLGHLHSEHVTEYPGFIERRVSSITAPDAWHNRSGYVGTIRKAQAFIWDKENGLETIINSTVRREYELQ